MDLRIKEHQPCPDKQTLMLFFLVFRAKVK